MKILSKLLMMLIIAFGTFAFSSCGNEDDDILPDNPNEVVQEGKWSIDGNTYTYTQSVDYGYGVSYAMKWTIVLDDNDKCVSSKCECTFSDKTVAQSFYEEWKSSDEVSSAKISGRTVTLDWSESHKGTDKEIILALIEAMGGGF